MFLIMYKRLVQIYIIFPHYETYAQILVVATDITLSDHWFKTAGYPGTLFRNAHLFRYGL